MILSYLNEPQLLSKLDWLVSIMTGYSWFTLPKVSWDFAFDKNSKNLIASFLFFELDVTPAPLTLICVPLPSWFGKNTATYVQPESWNSLIENKDTLVLDVKKPCVKWPPDGRSKPIILSWGSNNAV